DEDVSEFWTPLTGDDGAYMDKLVDEYNDQSDQELEIKHVVTSEMYTKLYTVMNSGSGISDLTLIHADRVPSFLKQYLLEPITPIMEAQPELNEDNYLEEESTDGNNGEVHDT